ncbi:MAG: transcription termination factor Rho [Omnitrophica bacterium RIFCSPLOWO2_12_FULL_44_17]|uniref:Transcription termination factor Rho n=1 Tax=Candidatus Danuiimicrobium aquiferis TaxID=1801832 RepID=A0A1G1L1A5_9BACT|nr:MAG: transcription termination factor Rho [Omnitrophica bacterium RIFCSPHIGHO2_02_FULL_45_28]OGW88178.1 MAG: transcription termination factor Rho [Omnitrophica bacterium RIFCSPHIGHO2_12_FULL_44_12]OGW98935.1 MAG: transcription termination factor Rho [Omnitrophica bacterium RIFCSPLOWO2_12_FULL_44_17]OGX02028.1 MAG: transcription termination factor Rho [Omnitrophica bacterium RIFCSPLOWO2_02_FULL_44_11]
MMKKFNHGESRHYHSNRPHHRHVSPVRTRQAGEAERRFLAGTAVDPSPRIRLEDGSSEMTMRVMDLICPIGMGQRGLIVAPPGSGKTTFLKHICASVAKSSPAAKLYCLLINERPEEVTDFRRSVPSEVRSSSLDESYEHHIATADKLMRQIFEEVADGRDVVLLLDSLTRLARVHNAEQRTSGRTLSGGVDARALEVPRRIFGAARKIENGGSLTILATILVDTGSRMDQVIFEEFKGTGNMEIYLSREISNRRIFPAVDISKSGTRKEELLLDADELGQIRKIRRILAEFTPADAMKKLIDELAKYPANRELLAKLGV